MEAVSSTGPAVPPLPEIPRKGRRLAVVLFGWYAVNFVVKFALMLHWGGGSTLGAIHFDQKGYFLIEHSRRLDFSEREILLICWQEMNLWLTLAALCLVLFFNYLAPCYDTSRKNGMAEK